MDGPCSEQAADRGFVQHEPVTSDVYCRLDQALGSISSLCIQVHQI